ncbi:hypothetical protein LG201_08390 [Methylobacillus gramineus]|uniref:sarcosine oxidase subunit gamma family protein n=1 Tax=Methylobacillus gramineus TaxID=755169 RepID=UPI001CFF74EB|nr:sarcosine oxidase subunit gamma family protein [Methylobacillus gramineus]MCB5185221.1 hypothetical protein [Methylobacillus gramineus]
MQTDKFITPIAHAFSAGLGSWGVINGMQVVTQFVDKDVEEIRKELLGIADASFLGKFGVKGRHAAQWLQDQGVDIPTQSNSWVADADGNLVLRLGGSEFLIEDAPDGNLCEKLLKADAKRAGVYLVPHVEASLVLSGSAVQELLVEVCSIDLTRAALGTQEVIMTQFAGVSVVLIHQDLEGEARYRVWCDSSYGPYLWEFMAGIASEHSGGPIGVGNYFSL